MGFLYASWRVSQLAGTPRRRDPAQGRVDVEGRRLQMLSGDAKQGVHLVVRLITRGLSPSNGWAASSHCPPVRSIILSSQFGQVEVL